ncbi:MAG: hypothetical protein GF418_13375 [Chitinivibrionales bacterium]|nr:hypothetical protein [Chitinivibrionales bacterium]MBD3396610.1 hypothetical protein [Chitinivibrionales bacterium]
MPPPYIVSCLLEERHMAAISSLPAWTGENAGLCNPEYRDTKNLLNFGASLGTICRSGFSPDPQHHGLITHESCLWTCSACGACIRGVIMNFLAVRSGIVPLLLIISFSPGFAGDNGNGGISVELQLAGAPAEAFPMYLCVDPAYMQPSGGNGGNGHFPKMVYTYVDGSRTECMTEDQFMKRFRSAAPVPPPPTPQDAYRRPVDPARKQLAQSDFTDGDMYGMDLKFANLKESKFVRADMRSVDLRFADCRNASFEDAYLKNADLSNADLTGASLKGAYIVGANLTNVRGLDLDAIRLVNCLYNCKLDDYLFDLVMEYCPSKLRDLSWNWGYQQAEQRGLGKRR